MPDNPVVLICPLDWGLGHASRVIPVIQQYNNAGYKVILGGDGKSLELLKLTFPDITAVTIPSYRVRYYGKSVWLIVSLLWQLPCMIFSLIREHLFIKKIVSAYTIGTIVSDNRYGLYCRNTHCIFITHQISPVLPMLLKPFEYLLYLLLCHLIERFNECWIPDCEGNHNISGKLSHRYRLPRNARYIGILSRFTNLPVNPQNQKTANYDLVIVLSGPQPMLRKFTLCIFEQARETLLKTLIIGGLQDNPQNQQLNLPVHYESHIHPAEFKELLVNAGYIICRAGYSGIMDLISLNRTALLIPTSGQPEQEYLAKYLSEKGLFCSVQESTLNLKNDLALLRRNTGRVNLSEYCNPGVLPIPYFNKKTTTIIENPSK